MKKAFYLLFLGVILVLPNISFATVDAVDNGYPEKIDSFAVNINLQSDGTAKITENILYDFGNNQKHGLYRVIPTFYKPRPGNPHQSISNISVTDGQGVAYPVNIQSSVTTDTLLVGDPNILINGKKQYIVSYDLKRVISSLADGDQFNWNAIGDGWDIPISNISIAVDTGGAKATDIRCYAGSYGSSSICKTGSFQASSPYKTSFFQKSLLPHQGMTVVADFPGGTFPAPSALEIFFWEKPWYYAIPVIIFLFYFALWFAKGRDPRGRGTIVPEYEAPDGITPVEAGYLLSNNMTNKGISAQIIYLATRGYLKVKKSEGEGLLKQSSYEFELIKDVLETDLVGKASMDFVFGGGSQASIDTIKADILENMMMLRTAVVKSVKDKNYYRQNPSVVAGIYIALTCVLFLPIALLALDMAWNWIGWLALAVSAVSAVIFSILMPKRTKEGAEMRERLFGLKMYINYAEKDRIKFHNEPKKDPQKFEELLPYAMIFGLEKEWAKQFENIYKQQPTWYVGTGYFTPLTLSDEISTFASFTTSAMFSSAAGSVGGGFAGGGGGGGGGGSW